jgi:hypothetical protein
MTVRLAFADAGEAADIAAFLARLIHYDRAAAVRLQAGAGALAVFGRPPSFEVLAIRTARLADTGSSGPVGPSGTEPGLDVTVSAGELLESVDESAGTADVPAAVTGPPWAGMLPPRGGWQQLDGLPSPDAVQAEVAAVVVEFRTRTEELAPESRTRAELDRIGREIWSRTLGETELPVRAAHAAQSLGFLRPVRAVVAAGRSAGEQPLALLAAGSWLRLRTPYGSIAVRRASALGGLSVTPA